MLLALYAKWCHTLGGKITNAPNRVFISFDPLDTSVFLGANIGGAGKLKVAIQQERFQWLKESGLTLGNASPMQAKGGQGFGHCSETIPLTVMML